MTKKKKSYYSLLQETLDLQELNDSQEEELCR